MAAYYKVDVVLNSQAVQVGLPSPQSVRVTLPLVGPQGPQGPAGPKGDPGEVSGSIAYENITNLPETFPPSSHTHTADQIVDFTSAVEAVSPPADWNTLANKPSTFPPSSHGHVAADVSDFSTAAAAAAPVQSVAGKTGTVTLAKADVGLSNVDNTSDLSKPISTATQTALDGKAASSHTHTASQVTDFTTAAAAAAPVQSVNGNTGTVTVAVPSASTTTPSALGVAAAGTASEFSRGDHVHAMPSASDVGAVSDTDARLSDSRDPNAHSNSHLPEGADEIFDQSLNTDDDVVFNKITVGNPEGQITIIDDQSIDSAYWKFGGIISINLENRSLNDADGFEVLNWSGSSIEASVPIDFTGDDAATNAATTRDNLGLGDGATADIGTTTGTVAAGDDSRFSDIPDPSTATPQALGSASAGTSDDYSRGDHVHAAPALNDLSNVSAATPSDNDVLVFDTATSTWVAEAPAASGIAETLLDAKGDLIVASAADTAARLAVGTNGHVLTVDSGETTGVKWAALPAGGSTNLWIPASAWIPRTTAGCGVDSREIGSTNRQNFDELLFDAGTDEFAQALVIMPSNYNNSTITARFYWTAASGSGDVIWGIQGRAYADDDALDSAHGTAQTATDTLLAADDMHVSAATSAVTIGGTPAANTPIQFQVYRDADAGGDTLAVDARLLGVSIAFN
jgi:hypothetical protein